MPAETLTTDPTPTTKADWQQSRIVRVLVRVARTYLQAALGFLTVSGIGTANAISGLPTPPPTDAGHMVLTALYAALFPALVALLMNGAEELGKIDPGTTQRG